MKISYISASVLLLLASVSAAVSQVINVPPTGAITGWDGYGTVYTVNGEINSTASTWGQLKAQIRIDFLEGDADSGSVDTLVVTIANTSEVDSLISEFYLKKPLLASPSSLLGESVPNDWALDASDLGPGYTPYYGDFGVPNQDPAKTEFEDNYFGAIFGSRLEDGTYVIPENGDPLFPVEFNEVDGYNNGQRFEGIGQFFFQFDEQFAISDWTDALDDGKPIFFSKWQAVDSIYGSSGKGYGGGPDFPPDFDPSNPPIPEPSEVALLAMLGLGGLLWGRKRLIKARAAK